MLHGWGFDGLFLLRARRPMYWSHPSYLRPCGMLKPDTKLTTNRNLQCIERDPPNYTVLNAKASVTKKYSGIWWNYSNPSALKVLYSLWVRLVTIRNVQTSGITPMTISIDIDPREGTVPHWDTLYPLHNWGDNCIIWQQPAAARTTKWMSKMRATRCVDSVAKMLCLPSQEGNVSDGNGKHICGMFTWYCITLCTFNFLHCITDLVTEMSESQ